VRERLIFRNPDKGIRFVEDFFETFVQICDEHFSRQYGFCGPTISSRWSIRPISIAAAYIMVFALFRKCRLRDEMWKSLTADFQFGRVRVRFLQQNVALEENA
jgi:hypothetical protein